MTDVLTENEVVLEHKPMEIVESTEFSGYQEAGGKLSEELYEKAQEALREENVVRWKFGEPTKQQAQNFASKFRFKLTPEQEFLYCYLQEEVQPPKLYDREVFAETLLITKDFKKYSKFTSAYPETFKKPASVYEEMIERPPNI